MQEALPYKRWGALPKMVGSATMGDGNGVAETVVKENPVVVLGKRGCCMCHVVRKLLLGLGVNPPMFEIEDGDNIINEGSLVNSLLTKYGDNKEKESLQFPLVFVGGELFGGLDKIMATHISGELIPILKQAGALWL